MAVHSSPEGTVHVVIGGPGLVFTELREGLVEPLRGVSKRPLPSPA